MPGVYIDMTEHAIIDVDTGKYLARIESARVEQQWDSYAGHYTTSYSRVDAFVNTKITLELTALVPEFGEGFTQPKQLSAPTNAPLPSVPKLLTKD